MNFWLLKYLTPKNLFIWQGILKGQGFDLGYHYGENSVDWKKISYVPCRFFDED